MFWIILALGAGLANAAKGAIVKKNLSSLPPMLVAWTGLFFGLPLLGGMLLLEAPTGLGPHFWPVLLLSGTLNAISVLLYIKAFQSASDLSLTMPMLAFGPLVVMLSSWLILGERPGWLGALSLLLFAVGAYALNLSNANRGLLAPYRALLHEPGPRYMLAVVLLWGIIGPFDKLGVQNSSPVFWVTATTLVATLLMLPLALGSIARIASWKQHLPTLVVAGFLEALIFVLMMGAVSMTLVAYVVAVKRSELLFGVVLGYMLFREGGMRARLAGSGVMMLGIVVLTFASAT
jgi:drug/metabolite transporter (DMT)-like permease